jgi:hypothetical protein
MLEVADALGDGLLDQRPHGDATNSVAGLIVHCCALTPWWLGHVALGDPTDRERDAEFHASAELADLHALVAETLELIPGLLARLEAGEGTDEGGRIFLLDGDESDASVVLHVIEELYQHVGHMELTADALLATA